MRPPLVLISKYTYKFVRDKEKLSHTHDYYTRVYVRKIQALEKFSPLFVCDCVCVRVCPSVSLFAYDSLSVCMIEKRDDD